MIVVAVKISLNTHFSVNNIPVSSYRVAYEEGNTQTCFLEIPMELVQEGYNSLSISAYARLYDEEGCIDDFTNAIPAFLTFAMMPLAYNIADGIIFGIIFYKVFRFEIINSIDGVVRKFL